MTSSFDTPFDALPQDIPVFPLPRVVLLPRVELPLNVFEPRYMAMTTKALSGARLIGMIQPRNSDDDVPLLYDVGCAGRIVSFSETEDGRYLVTLRGVCRFKVARELDTDAAGFRRVEPDWSPFRQDMAEEDGTAVCRDALVETLHRYFDQKGMFCDKWEEMYAVSCERLIATLCVVCPLATEEKQALLEAPGLEDRAQLLQSVLERHAGAQDAPQCH